MWYNIEIEIYILKSYAIVIFEIKFNFYMENDYQHKIELNVNHVYSANLTELKLIKKNLFPHWSSNKSVYI